METDKDAVKNELKEAAIRDQKEAVAGTDAKRHDFSDAVEQEGMSSELAATTEKPAEQALEADLLSDVAEGEVDKVQKPVFQSMDDEPSSESDPHAEEKVRINFFGSEILRAQAPKVFEVADAVADEWMKDGRFEGLPVGHPLAQLATQVGLRKAKDLEKKLDEKGVFLLAKTGFAYLKSKLPK